MSGTRAKKIRRAARQGMVNSRPAVAGSAPLMTSAEALRMVRQNKHNPLPSLKPEMLARVLDAFEHGYLREAVLLWEKIAERDDVILSVKPKREKDVSQLDMQVTTEPDSGADGEAHKAILEKFWRNVRAVNAYDRNEKGGFRRLVKQMMTATSYRYAAHHIIWDPRPDGELRATFEFVPLWMFENRTGTLRYLPSTSATQGEALADGEWMVTVGDGLMIACCIGYLAKRSSFNDWLIFSEKFSVPGVLGRTTAKMGSAEGEAMREAVESFGHDWVGVIYEDDGAHGEPIKLVQAQGSPQGQPMPAIIERVDRKFAALYRGADLSSMSSGDDAVGASLQQKETDILRRDDAETINETLADVSRMVVEWHFGHGVEPLARVELIVPGDEDQGREVEVDSKLKDLGVSQDPGDLAERYGRKHLASVPVKLPPAGPPRSPWVTLEELANADLPDGPESLQALRTALAADLQPLGDALFGAYSAGDEAAMRAALKKISTGMPELAGDAANLSTELSVMMAAAFTGGSEELENAGNSSGAIKGWETRRANGWTSKRAAAQIARGTESMRQAIDTKTDVMDALDVPGLGKVDFRWGDDNGGIQHIVTKHGEAEAMQVPAMLFAGQLAMSKNRAWVSTADSYVLLTNNFKGTPSNHWVITGYVRS